MALNWQKVFFWNRKIFGLGEKRMPHIQQRGQKEEEVQKNMYLIS